MFKELSNDVENFVTPDHGCLIGWAQQGLLIILSAENFIPQNQFAKYVHLQCILVIWNPSETSLYKSETDFAKL